MEIDVGKYVDEGTRRCETIISGMLPDRLGHEIAELVDHCSHNLKEVFSSRPGGDSFDLEMAQEAVRAAIENLGLKLPLATIISVASLISSTVEDAIDVAVTKSERRKPIRDVATTRITQEHHSRVEVVIETSEMFLQEKLLNQPMNLPVLEHIAHTVFQDPKLVDRIFHQIPQGELEDLSNADRATWLIDRDMYDLYRRIHSPLQENLCIAILRRYLLERGIGVDDV